MLIDWDKRGERLWLENSCRDNRSAVPEGSNATKSCAKSKDSQVGECFFHPPELDRRFEVLNDFVDMHR